MESIRPFFFFVAQLPNDLDFNGQRPGSSPLRLGQGAFNTTQLGGTVNAFETRGSGDPWLVNPNLHNLPP